MVKSGRVGRYNRNQKKGTSGEPTLATKSKFVLSRRQLAPTARKSRCLAGPTATAVRGEG